MLSFITRPPCQNVDVADLNSLCVLLVQLVLHVPHKLCRRPGPLASSYILGSNSLIYFYVVTLRVTLGV